MQSLPCQLCGQTKPAAHFTFHRNLGLIAARRWYKLEGTFCKECAKSAFWKETVLTLIFGWWGLISFFSNWFALFNNLAQLPKISSLPQTLDAFGHIPDPSPWPRRVVVAFAGLTVVGIAAVAYNTATGGTKGRLISRLEKETQAHSSEATLTQETACQLTQLAVLNDHNTFEDPKNFKCLGPLSADARSAQLKGVGVGYGFTDVTVCLRKNETRWFASNLGPCAEAPLNANVDGATLDEKETNWRREETERAIQNLEQARKEQATKIMAQIDEDKAAPKFSWCSRQLLRSYERPVSIGTFSQEQLEGKSLPVGWHFLESTSFALNHRPYLNFMSSSLSMASNEASSPLIAVLATARSKYLPTPSVSGFDSGEYIGTLYLVDNHSGNVLCASTLSFLSSKTVYHRKSKYGTGHSDLAQKLTIDFTARYHDALQRVLSNAWSAPDNAAATQFQEGVISEYLAGDETGKLPNSRNVASKKILQNASDEQLAPLPVKHRRR